jgi:hypothetical protein
VRGLSASVLAAGLVLGACSSSSSATRSTTLASSTAPATTTTLATTTSSTTTTLPPTTTTTAAPTTIAPTTVATAPIKDIHSKEAVVAALTAYYDVLKACLGDPPACTPSMLEKVATGDQFQTSLLGIRKAVASNRRYQYLGPDDLYANVTASSFPSIDRAELAYCIWGAPVVFDTKGTRDSADDSNLGVTSSSRRYTAGFSLIDGSWRLASNVFADEEKRGVNECGVRT